MNAARMIHLPTSMARTNYSSGGYVYFITSEPDEFVKIGWSLHSPLERLNTLQTGCPQPLRLMAYVPASRDEERRLHQTFEELRFRGEWFFNQHKLYDLIQYLSDDHPRPTQSGATRDRFEAATWDVIITGYTHPDMPDEAEYLRSGDGRFWHHLHPEEAWA